MPASQNFIAKDYLRAFDLKNIFHKYVVYYTQLHYSDGEEPLSNKDRHELSLKIQDALNEMSLQVLKMKESKPATEASRSSIPKLSMHLSKASECRAAN